MHRDLYVVVAVNPQDVFHEVGLAPHVDAVRRYADLPCAIAFRFDRHAERVDDFSDGRLRDRFADQPDDPVVRHLEPERLDPHRVDVGYGRSNDASGQFADQQRGALERVRRHVRVDSAFVAERRVGTQSVAFGRFADPDRVEIGALDKYFGRRVRYARVESAEHAGDTHRPFGVADHQVFGRQFAFHTVQRNERRPFRAGSHDDFVSFDFRRVECVQRLSGFV